MIHMVVTNQVISMMKDSIISKMRNKWKKESTEEIVKTLWQIQGLLSEGAPAIALRRVTELLGKMGD